MRPSGVEVGGHFCVMAFDQHLGARDLVCCPVNVSGVRGGAGQSVEWWRVCLTSAACAPVSLFGVETRCGSEQLRG